MLIKQNQTNSCGGLFEVPNFSARKVCSSNESYQSPELGNSFTSRIDATSKLCSVHDKNHSSTLSLLNYIGTESFNDGSIRTTQDMNARLPLPTFGISGLPKSHKEQVPSYNNTKKEFLSKENEVLKEMVIDLQEKFTHAENVIDRLENEIRMLREIIKSQASQSVNKCSDYRVSFPRCSVYGDGRYQGSRGSIYGDRRFNNCNEFYNPSEFVSITENANSTDEYEMNGKQKGGRRGAFSKFNTAMKFSWSNLSAELASASDLNDEKSKMSYDNVTQNTEGKSSTNLAGVLHNGEVQWNKIKSGKMLSVGLWHQRALKREKSKKVINQAA